MRLTNKIIPQIHSTTRFQGGNRSTLVELGSYEEPSCRVTAIENESGLSSNPDPYREFTGDERMTVVGSNEAVWQFRKQFDV